MRKGRYRAVHLSSPCRNELCVWLTSPLPAPFTGPRTQPVGFSSTRSSKPSVVDSRAASRGVQNCLSSGHLCSQVDGHLLYSFGHQNPAMEEMAPSDGTGWQGPERAHPAGRKRHQTLLAQTYLVELLFLLEWFLLLQGSSLPFLWKPVALLV